MWLPNSASAALGNSEVLRSKVAPSGTPPRSRVRARRRPSRWVHDGGLILRAVVAAVRASWRGVCGGAEVPAPYGAAARGLRALFTLTADRADASLGERPPLVGRTEL